MDEIKKWFFDLRTLRPAEKIVNAQIVLGCALLEHPCRRASERKGCGRGLVARSRRPRGEVGGDDILRVYNGERAPRRDCLVASMARYACIAVIALCLFIDGESLEYILLN